MPVSKRLLLMFLLLGMGNAPLLFLRLSPPVPLAILALLLLAAPLLWCCIRPGDQQGRLLPRKLRLLEEGSALYETTLVAALCFLLELGLFWALPALRLPPPLLLANFMAGVGLLVLPLTVGLLRLLYGAEQLGAFYRYLILATWWLPLVGVFLNLPTYRAAKGELRFVRQGHLRDLQRHDQQVCHTRYPLLLLHSGFYPDWKAETCWGRIPEALRENGARLHYGAPSPCPELSQRAEALCASLQGVLAECGCEKVNILAHSGRGVEARYAISALGLAERVASLTTICTPHRGCLLAQGVLEQRPGAEAAVPQRDQLMEQLADLYPDFYSPLAELSPEACAALNQQLPDAPGVYYQSVGAKMASEGAAGFPFNMSHRILQPLIGENDGLVATSSMPWGTAYREISPAGAQGVSHGDVIDLTRRNIPGFDVCEFYVGLVQALGARGL